MTENQFVKELEKAITQLPEKERKEILLDIREYFFAGREDGKTDSEIAASLGSPANIAEELLLASSFEETTPQTGNNNECIIIENSYTKIDINVDHGGLIVRPSNDTKTTVELDGRAEKFKLSADVIGDTLVIRLKRLRHWLLMFYLTQKAVTLNVFIPKKLYQSLTMKTDNGRIDAVELAGKEIVASSDNGRITLEKVEAENVKSSTDNGRIEMRDINAASLRTKTDNGRIVLDHVNGSIIGETDNGRITYQAESMDQNLDLRTDNGKILIESRTEPQNVSIHARTQNGRMDIFGEQNSRTVIGAGENIVRLKTDNGRITVKHM